MSGGADDGMSWGISDIDRLEHGPWPGLVRGVKKRAESGVVIACGGGGRGSGYEMAEHARLMSELEAMLIISTIETGMPSMFRNSLARQLERSLYPSQKPTRECLLPGCQNQTQHNGGYCCADCCLAHRAIIKGRG